MPVRLLHACETTCNGMLFVLDAASENCLDGTTAARHMWLPQPRHASLPHCNSRSQLTRLLQCRGRGSHLTWTTVTTVLVDGRMLD